MGLRFIEPNHQLMVNDSKEDETTLFFFGFLRFNKHPVKEPYFSFTKGSTWEIYAIVRVDLFYNLSADKCFAICGCVLTW